MAKTPKENTRGKEWRSHGSRPHLPSTCQCCRLPGRASALWHDSPCLRVCQNCPFPSPCCPAPWSPTSVLPGVPLSSPQLWVLLLSPNACPQKPWDTYCRTLHHLFGTFLSLLNFSFVNEVFLPIVSKLMDLNNLIMFILESLVPRPQHTLIHLCQVGCSGVDIAVPLSLTLRLSGWRLLSRKGKCFYISLKFRACLSQQINHIWGLVLLCVASPSLTAPCSPGFRASYSLLEPGVRLLLSDRWIATPRLGPLSKLTSPGKAFSDSISIISPFSEGPCHLYHCSVVF